MVIVIDNYDSFTYNLVQYLGELGAETEVLRNDACGVAEIRRAGATHVVISPGPGTPADAGVSVELVRTMHAQVPILGVCLGHQCIAAAFGARIVRAERVMHAKPSLVRHDGGGVFAGLPERFRANRYHSLVVEPGSLPDELRASAWTDDGAGAPCELMGLRHARWPVEGVQFHPESIMTEHGHTLLENFLRFGGN